MEGWSPRREKRARPFAAAFSGLLSGTSSKPAYITPSCPNRRTVKRKTGQTSGERRSASACSDPRRCEAARRSRGARHPQRAKTSSSSDKDRWTRRVRLLREEGRGVSSQYGREGGAKTWFMSGTPQRARPGRVRKREATSATQSSSAPPAWTRRRGCWFSSGFLQRSTKLLRSRIGTMLPAARDGKQCCVGPAPPREQRRRRPRSRSGSAGSE